MIEGEKTSLGTSKTKKSLLKKKQPSGKKQQVLHSQLIGENRTGTSLNKKGGAKAGWRGKKERPTRKQFLEKKKEL